MAETGHFAALWHELAQRLALDVDLIPGDWRRDADPAEIEARLRAAIDRAGHPALYLVDTISSLASIDHRHDERGVDVTVGGSQKGLMLPPGLSFNAISAKALAASEHARLPRAYWDWKEMLASNATGYFPYTPATNLLYGLHEALRDAVRGRPSERTTTF